MCPEVDTFLGVFDGAAKAARIFHPVAHHEQIKNIAPFLGMVEI
jgi:hypothetical protein